jgi:hypothetical protein
MKLGIHLAVRVLLDLERVPSTFFWVHVCPSVIGGKADMARTCQYVR